ncbi:MAG: hypothetical protein RR216_07230, partial [Pseudoflavonifractor sp.]
MHRCLEKYPRFEDFMFLDVHKIMNLLPLLEAALPPSEKEQLERAYAILELIKNDYLHAEEDAFMFTKDGILCDEAEADTFF